MLLGVLLVVVGGGFAAVAAGSVDGVGASVAVGHRHCGKPQAAKR